MIAKDYETLCSQVVESILFLSKERCKESGFFYLVLSGGTTPKGVYSRMADTNFEWDKIHFFWGDERWVPQDHPQSNYKLVWDALFSKVDVPKKNIHPILTDQSTPEKSAQLYEQELDSFFKNHSQEKPRFDLILLGVGKDGHTASLFPESQALNEKRQWVVSVEKKETQEKRVTLTYPLLNQALNIYFLVHGKEKAEIVKEILESKKGQNLFPVQIISPTNGTLKWFLDEEAAALLKRKDTLKELV